MLGLYIGVHCHHPAFHTHLKESNDALEICSATMNSPQIKSCEYTADPNLLLLLGNVHRLMGETGHLEEKGPVTMS